VCDNYFNSWKEKSKGRDGLFFVKTNKFLTQNVKKNEKENAGDPKKERE
jgi:hypothetical protein